MSDSSADRRFPGPSAAAHARRPGAGRPPRLAVPGQRQRQPARRAQHRRGGEGNLLGGCGNRVGPLAFEEQPGLDHEHRLYGDAPAADAGGDQRFHFSDDRYPLCAGAGMSNSIAPTWQGGSGPKCYPFRSTDAGSIFATVTYGGGQIWMDLLDGAAPCLRSPGLAPMGGASPYVTQFLNKPAGSYQLMIETSPAGTGPVAISYPVATYDIRSQANPQTGARPPSEQRPAMTLSGSSPGSSTEGGGHSVFQSLPSLRA